ncbi:arginine--tRNA ligase [Anaeromassilibacillus sp. An200]|uniref:Arginine--tRNA ligase n=1 Tax=Candidatus Caccousia stercoris TaxID=2840723 RepID=A0A9D1K2H8_9FIRM|nr:arginine--tRNA ligase [Anaeromassilibacillus sp. An200]OUP14018.1 arginine--tRNA ligase [Anaeromassilibacillus sp. An200]HIS79370.1 arginine--tRNA ligase [Candidatus Caccousia stercoris]
MSKLVQQATQELRTAIEAAMRAAIEDGSLPQADLPAFTLEVPADRSHGDWACNAAMAGARAFRQAPRKIAESIASHLDLAPTYFDRCEIAGPGFLNFFLNPRFYADVLRDVEALGKDYGRSDYGKGEKVMVEFVSANPTGPMHMGNARGGALGDCLAAVLDAAGYDVWREFYVNDAGNQIEKFGISLEARYLQILQGEDAVEFPEDGYHGDDIREHAQNYVNEHGDGLLSVSPEERRAALVQYALPKNIARMQRDLEKYRIQYDKWFLESTLHEDGEVMEIVDILTKKGLTYEKEGAVWYRATDFGAEKDEVLIRQNGNPTYFTADIAYHRNKFNRGFTRCIDVWGADHHGHVARMKGAMDAVGLDGSKLDVVLIQLVRLVRAGEVVRMSKRSGKAIQLADLLDEVPIDAARFLFNMREANTQMDFDLDLAVQEDSQNPVYYVQYAHARICSLFQKLAGEGLTLRPCTSEELALLSAPEEIELLRHIASYTDEIVAAARGYDPARITRYVITLANLFHSFYNACRIGGEEDSLAHARLQLCSAVLTVIRNVLGMFKITAPERM